MERIKDIAILVLLGVILIIVIQPKRETNDYSIFMNEYLESKKRELILIEKLNQKYDSWNKIDTTGRNPEYVDSLHNDFLIRSGFND